jgi:ABC-type transporter Mla MlaB component
MNARRKKSPARAVPAKKPATARKRPPHATQAAARPASGSTKRRAATGPREALGADCTIEHAPALHKRLAKVLANRACVTLDLGGVRRCDTAGLQVLVAFVRERREAGREVELKDAPDSIRSAAKLLGLSEVLGLAAPAAKEGLA